MYMMKINNVRDIKNKMIENDEVDRLMNLVRDGIMSERDI